MPYRPHCNGFNKRAVYKTEFDIFKQSTDIELISLISYEGEGKSGRVTKKENASGGRQQNQTIQRNVKSARGFPPTTATTTTSRFTERRQITRSAYLPNRDNNNLPKYHRPETAYRIRNARTKVDTEIYKDFAKTTKTFLKTQHSSDNRRACKSALTIRKPLNTQPEPPRSQTTFGFHPVLRLGFTSAHVNHLRDNSKTNNPSAESKFKPVTNNNLVTSVNKAWRARTAYSYTRLHTNVNSIRNNKSKQIENQSKSLPNLNSATQVNDTQSNKQDQPSVAHVSEDRSRNVRSVPVCSEHSRENFENLTKPTIGTVNVSVDLNLDKTLRQNNVENNGAKCNDIDASAVVLDAVDGCSLLKEDGVPVESGVSETCLESQNDFFASKDSGIDSHVLTPDCFNKAQHSDEESDTDSSDRRVKFCNDTEFLFVPDNSEDLESVSVSDAGSDDNDHLGEEIDAISEINISDKEIIADLPQRDGYDVNDLITDLERFDNQSRLSVVSQGIHSLVADDVNSLFCESTVKIEKPLEIPDEEPDVKKKETPVANLDDFTMSSEARRAILETLNEMGTSRNNSHCTDDFLHKSVSVQRQLKDNRSRYDHYTYRRRSLSQRGQLRSLEGSEDMNSQYSSQIINPDLHPAPQTDHPDSGQLFPSIAASPRQSKSKKSLNNQTTVYSLEQVKGRKYKIPGIGQYKFGTDPDTDFEITPPGFDCRYNTHPAISKDEQDTPPRFIRERSIQKCENWLTQVNVSPLALKPVRNKNHKQSTTPMYQL